MSSKKMSNSPSIVQSGFNAAVQRVMAIHGLKIADLSRMTEIEYSYLRRLLKDERNWNVKQIDAVIIGLNRHNIKFSFFFGDHSSIIAQENQSPKIELVKKNRALGE